MQDVIVIGGSYSGMAAALQLLRARRKVLVIDAGQRRNRFVDQSHGFLGQDGNDPTAIWAEAKRQLEAYPTLTWRDDTATAISGGMDDFRVTLQSGEEVSARRILLATGVSDALPDVPGLAERWGKAVFHCPYCHGYELDQGRIGVIATGPMSVHQAALLTEWGEITFFLNGAVALESDQREELTVRGVAIEETPISRITGDADIELGDGRVLSFAGLFTATRTDPAGSLVEQVGCALMATPIGSQILTDESKQTSIPGIFACGDTARAPHSVSLAVGDGAWAGAQVHRSLIWP
ncbi:NAD(P)/FAD-dependent oxidoreductase [Paracoccus caeni]|uniref:Thioredoxin reductase n=1 Tax=Paracoccus caeni TaxID=657651 RepID=A0A934S922_9RHOB|nr:NAD(P)/FAD-dependent oxidoreductase [Paracoccus caeni]MBK4214371.1 NAD(P)/FAD-dependent oxidoreductase [Paracoccus caeni]